MRISLAPRVILVARPSLDWEGIRALLDEYGTGTEWVRNEDDADGDSLTELMGRLCYGSFNSPTSNRQGRVGAAAYHANILSSGHGSVLEHACWSFVVTGASRGFTHQMVRHRAGVSPSQESQHFIRYSADDDEPGAQEACICLTGVPEELRPAYVASAEASVAAYASAWRALKAAGLPKKAACERARGLLPSCLESRLGLTMNARAIRHFAELRGTTDNVLEIRLVACEMARVMKAEAPAMFQDFEVVDGGDGRPTVTSGHKKV